MCELWVGDTNGHDAILPKVLPQATARRRGTMPPRIRRQSLERRDAAIRKHLPKAREYWVKWPEYLAEGDLCQAGEKAWGAVSQLTKAVAAHRGWQHSDHDKLREVIRELANESSENREIIIRGLTSADVLHGNFYEIFLDQFQTELALSDVRYLVEALWSHLPNEYTDGVSFSQWTASDTD